MRRICQAFRALFARAICATSGHEPVYGVQIVHCKHCLRVLEHLSVTHAHEFDHE